MPKRYAQLIFASNIGSFSFTFFIFDWKMNAWATFGIFNERIFSNDSIAEIHTTLSLTHTQFHQIVQTKFMIVGF
jgi:hypothetical protein